MMTLALNAPFQDLFFRGDSLTETVESTDGLFMFLWWHSVFWFVLLMGLTAYFVIRYRRVPGKPAEPSRSHNLLLETFWTVVPSSILVLIFLWGFWGYIDKVVPEGDAMELSVTGYKWGWTVRFPNGFETTDTAAIDEGGRKFPVILLPEDTDFRLRMNSSDVIHSFWIPDLRVKMDVMPNRYTGYGFSTPALEDDAPTIRMKEDGPTFQYRDMWVFCAEYCGDFHAEMAAIFRIVPRPVFDQWVNDAGEPSIDVGRQIWQIRCATCHTIDGSSLTGPTWLGGAEYQGNVYGYGYPANIDGYDEPVDRDADYFRESVLVPGAKVVSGYPGNMPSFDGQLNDSQLEALLLFYQSLSDRGPSLDDGAPDDEGSENPPETPDENPDESSDDTAAQS